MRTQPVFVQDARIQSYLEQQESQRQQLREQLLAGAMSPTTGPITPAYFHGLRERIFTTRLQRIHQSAN